MEDLNPKLNQYAKQFIAYKEEGQPVNEFLVAVLVGDFEPVIMLADDDLTLHDLRLLAEFVQINIPNKIKNSKEAIHAHFVERNEFFKSSSKIESDKSNGDSSGS